MDAIRAKLCGEGGELTEEELTRYFFALSSSEPVEPLATLVGSVEGLALRQVCQYQFKRGDIAWLCRSCQKDETCVLCNTCWHNSNHEGHEVYYYHSQAGGCCDCGDCGAWNPAGFCSRHGQKLDDPCSCIPDSTLRAGTELIEAIAVETSSYTSFLPSTFTASAGDDDFDGTENWSAVLLLDDMHKPEEFAAELEWLTRTRTLTGADGFRLTSLFKRVGMAAVAVSADLDDVDAVAQHLRSRGYLCSVCSPKTIARRDNLVVAINWLHSLVLLSDAVCRMFSTAISASFRLQALVSSGCYLDKTMMHGLHNLVLSTMADQQFKENLSKAYADSFPALCRAYAMGIGLQECSFFSLSVQYLNRESFVSGMVNDHDFFRNAVLALAEMLDNASAELQLGGSLIDDKCLHFRRYNPLLADLRIIFSILTSNRRFVTETLNDLLDLFSSLSGMHPQTRQLGHHVHFEDRQWIVAFNLYLGVGGLFESLSSWISSSKDAHLNVPDENKSSVVLLSASDFVRALLERLLQWLEGENMDRSIADYSYVIPSKNNTTFVAYLSNHTHDRLGEDEERHTKSFHYFLHRLFASAILESTKSPALVDLLNSIDLISPDDKTNNGLRDKDDDEGSVFPLIVDHPLDSLAFGAEIKVGLWVRNGTCMRDQLVNYDEVPYCRIFKELDIALLQFFGARTYKNECIVPLVARVFHRYGIYDYILTGGQSDTDTMRASEDEVTKSAMLFEEALLLFLIIITELPQPPPEDLAARALENMRREIIHRACAEHTTFSQLHDCTLNVSDHARVGTGAIERLIREVTVQGGEPALSSMEAPKLSLCPSLWGEYNPVHMHLPARLHQVCIETRPRVLAESPMVLAPPEVHPAYSGFRAVLLSDELLLASVRLHAVGYAAGQVSEHAGSAAKSAYDPIESRMACRESLWSRCLHFLTLIAHELEGADNDFREMIVSFLLFNCAGTSTSAEETVQLTTLKALMDIRRYPGTTKSHSNNMMWLGWVLSRFASLDGRVKAYIDVRNKTRDAEERAKMLETRKQQARERSIQMMRSRAESFAATMHDGAGDDDDDVGDSGAQSGGEHDQHEEDEALMCIICHRHTADKDDRLGLQFLSQGSQVCGRLPPRESDTLHTTPNQLPRDQPNLFLSSCKHAMHFKCFDIYFADVVAQSEANNGLILDTKVGQFLCPCCKRVANCLVPFHSTRVAERLFKRPRTDDAAPSMAAGETGGDVFDLVHTLSVSAKSLQHEPPLLQVEEEHFWTRVLDQVTSPENRHPLTPQFTLSATSCAFLRRLEVAVAAVRYTVRCDMALRTCPGRSIAAKQDAGLDEHAHLSSVIASIGSTMKHAGMVKAMFLDALIASVANPLTGHAFADSVDPNQYQERHPSDTFDWLQGFLLGLHRGILSLPSLDILVLTLACCSDSPETTVPQDMSAKVSMCLSSARLLSIASLVQICVAVVFDRREGVDIHCDVDVDIDILESIDSFIDHIFESLTRTAHFGSGTPLLNVAKKELILRKWVAFLRIALEIIYRSKISGVVGHPDAFFIPRAESGLLLGLILSSTYLHALGLEAYLFDDAPHAAATKHMISCWIKSSVASRSIVTLCNRGAQPFDLPVLPKPITFTRLPAAYTTLHAQVKELSPYEFPAICMTCSQILDAGGTGQVTVHCRVCSADGGAAFLLQESVILLLHGDRASYFPSPYIDENGERGKLSRGKPLMWDDRRGALLNTLYAQHELGREVMQKRTSSQRVVIANHY